MRLASDFPRAGLVAAALQKVADELMATNSEDRLRVELNTFDIEFPMAQTHDESVLGLRGDLEHVGNRTSLDNE